MKPIFGLLLGLVVIGGIFVATRQQPSRPSVPTIVTSFYPLYFFTKEIAGDTLIITNITPAGSEPHEYEPTAKETALIEKSDLVILQGAFEPWAQSVTTKKLVVGEKLITDTHTDPHTWLSPQLAKQTVIVIANALKEYNPAVAGEYDHRAQALLNQLDQLQKMYTQRLTDCKRREFITSHAAFGHLAQEFNLTQLSIAGISPENEPSAQKMAEITQFAKAHDIHYIFFESLVSPKFAQTIATEVGAQTLVLNPLEGLTDQELSEGKNYFTEMTQNLNNLTTALTCTP